MSLTSLVLALSLSAVPTVRITGNVLTPGGSGVTSGTVTCRLTTPGTAMDGTTAQRVATEKTVTLTASTGAIDLSLVPNDAITPSGTRYTCTFNVVLPTGRRVLWAEQWQVYGSPSAQDIGDIANPTYPLHAAMRAATPSFAPSAGTIAPGSTVTLSANTPGSIIYYTTNGDTPTTSSTVYSGPITLYADTTIKAVAAPLLGWTLSDVGSAAYVIADGDLYSFSTPGCYQSGANAGLTSAAGDPVNAWRTGTKGGSTGSGWQSCGPAAAFVGTSGVLVEPAISNIISQSDTINSGSWSSYSSMVVTADQYTAPDGTLTMDKLASGAGATRYQGGTVASSTGPFTASAWVRADTGTQAQVVQGACNPGNNVVTCTCAVSSGTCTATISGTQCNAKSTVGTTPVLISSTFTCTNTTTGVYIALCPGDYPSSGGTAGYWHASLHAGAFPTATVTTTVGAASTAADAVALMNGIPTGTSAYCIRATVKPAWGRPWTAATSTLWTMGTSGANNSQKLEATSAGNLVYTVIDSFAQTKTCTVAHAYGDGTSQTLWACNNAGALSLWNGTSNLSCSQAGAGSGVVGTQPFGAWVGSGSADGSESGTWISDFGTCAKSTPTACNWSGTRRTLTGPDRYVWQGTAYDKRTQDRGVWAWPFTWLSDPSLRSSVKLRTALLGSSAFTSTDTTITVPADYDTLNGGMQWRDGSVAYDRTLRRYFAVISSIGPQTNNWATDRWSVFTSVDGLAWTFVTYVIVPGSYRVWTPEIFVDSDGQVYVLASVSTGLYNALRPKIWRLDTPADWATWTDLGFMSGSAMRTGLDSVPDYHDSFMYKLNGQYHAFLRCYTTSGTCVAGEIDHLVSDSLLTGYSTRTVVTVGGSNLVSEGIELQQLPSGQYRIYFDDFSGAYAGCQICRADSADLTTFGSYSNVLDADFPNRNSVFVLGF